MSATKLTVVFASILAIVAIGRRASSSMNPRLGGEARRTGEIAPVRVAQPGPPIRAAREVPPAPTITRVGDAISTSGAPADIGTDTPLATARTLRWYLEGGDIKRAATLLAFEPADQARVEAVIDTLPEDVRAHYGSAASFTAFMMAGTQAPLAGIDSLNGQLDSQAGVEHLLLRFQDGENREETVAFHHQADGWKQVMPATTADQMIAYLRQSR